MVILDHLVHIFKLVGHDMALRMQLRSSVVFNTLLIQEEAAHLDAVLGAQVDCFLEVLLFSKQTSNQSNIPEDDIPAHDRQYVWKMRTYYMDQDLTQIEASHLLQAG